MSKQDESIRPWGNYEILLDAEYCKVKRIFVKPGQRLSYQYHHKRQEAWTVVSGVARITLDDVTEDYKPGETVLIPLGAKHRMANPSDGEMMILIEVQTGTYFGEDDIVRVQDDYDRPENTNRSNIMKTVAVSGYFDPIHVGHLEYLELAKELGDRLVVIVNNNHQCVLKKGKPFMDEADRVKIVEALGIVDEVFLSIDKDKSVCASLDAIKPDIFANGGDRRVGEVPESVVCKKHKIEMIDDLGEKIRSSSKLTGLKEKK